MLGQDIRYAITTLRRAPGFTIAAILSLALGIGANTAIFSAIDEILLRPIAVPLPGQLAQVYSFNRKTATYVSSSYPDYLDFRQRAQSFEQLSAYVRMRLNVVLGRDGTEKISIEAVSDNYFDMLRLPPLAGRLLRAEDDRAGAPPVVMVAEELWRRRFQTDPAIVGKSIRIEGQAFTVVGVVPDRLSGMNLNWATPPQFWIPIHTTPLAMPQLAAVFQSRPALWLVLTGRLKPGVTTATAQAELRTIAASLVQTEPSANRDFTATVFPLSRSKFWPAYRSAISNSLAVFGVACGLVLLLACANVSNLLLERAVKRRREFAVRLAIGASRSRLVRQLLTESLTLALPAGLAAVLVAQAMMKLLLRFPNALGLPLSLHLTVEPRAMLFCLGLSLAATALFGLAPALQATRPSILPALKQTGNALAGTGNGWLRGSLVVLQVAFSTILLVGGGLYGRSLTKAYAVDLGFRREGLVTANFGVAGGPAALQRLQNAQQLLLGQLAAMPGVDSATVTSAGLMSPVVSKAQVESEAGSTLSIDRELVGPDFFRTMGIPLVSGRDVSARDQRDSENIAVVNQVLAARLWPQRDAIGRSIVMHGQAGGQTVATVVGVARNAKYGSVWEDPQPHLYLAAFQSESPAANLVFRTTGRPDEVGAAVRKAWTQAAPSFALSDFETADDGVNRALMPQRVAAGIFGAFGLLAIVLASVGLYSLVAYSVVQRRREIAIRMAIGAQPWSAISGIVRSSMRLTAAGLVLGTAGSFLLMRFAATQIKEVSAYDGPTYLAVALLLASISCAAALIPARRAMRVDPLTALRGD
jgi:predicted permease